MHIDFDNYEYNDIVSDIMCNREFKKLDGFSHHGTSRLLHSIRVSYYSYKICKMLNLDYISAARGGLLHDFFVNKYNKECNKRELLVNHPDYALYNSRKHFTLNDIENDIIKCHMFPVNIKYIPKYRESYIITFIDKISCVYERIVCFQNIIGLNFGKLMVYMLLIFTNYGSLK